MAATKAELEQENEELKAQLAQQGEAPAGPHVLTALKTILGSLAVKKDGQLPPNMGGKSYISAVDLNYEVKTLFVQNGLVLTPKEKVIRYEFIEFKSRMNTFMVIEGTYRITSTVDATSVEVGGIGDGIAAGSAVASNIASTNALKNALLRTFMVTEQSAEDAAKNGPDEAPESGGTGQAPALAKAAQASAPRQAAPAPVAVAEPPEKAKIRAEFIDNPRSPYTREQVNSVMDQVKGLEEFRGDKMFPEIYRRLQTGELE